MAVTHMNLSELKAYAESDSKAFASPSTADKTKQWNYSPMFLPISTSGRHVMNVTTRSDFLHKQVGNWKTIQINLVLTIVIGIAALWLLSVNVLLAGAAALVAGWLYGEHMVKKFFLYKVYKRRMLLEGT